MTPLCFPNHFPPKDRWNKFFIGVRWLGPDLSFFKELRDIQRNRNQSEMEVWGGGKRQEIAESISEILSRELGWRSKVFLPIDMVEVIFHGPKFDFIDADGAFELVLEMLLEKYGINRPNAFLESKAKSTFGELVSELTGENGG